VNAVQTPCGCPGILASSASRSPVEINPNRFAPTSIATG
jgi:hypothetical protein